MTWNHERPHDDEIRRALADLPRERAAGGFTERVLRRLDQAPKTASPTREPFPRFRWQPALAGTAVALVLVAVLLAAGVLRPTRDGGGSPESGPVVAQTDGHAGGSTGTSPSAARAHAQDAAQEAAVSGDPRPEVGALLEELRREHSKLERDLRDLRELAEGSRVMYVGGDESLDFVLELGAEPPREPGSGVRPASLREPGAGGGPSFF